MDLYQQGVLIFLTIQDRLAAIEDPIRRVKYLVTMIRGGLRDYVHYDHVIHTPTKEKRKAVIDLDDIVLISKDNDQYDYSYLVKTAGERQVLAALLCGYTISEISVSWGTSRRSIRRILNGISQRYVNSREV